MKKTIALALALTMSLSLAACGGGTSSGSWDTITFKMAFVDPASSP